MGGDSWCGMLPEVLSRISGRAISARFAQEQRGDVEHNEGRGVFPAEIHVKGRAKKFPTSTFVMHVQIIMRGTGCRQCYIIYK